MSPSRLLITLFALLLVVSPFVRADDKDKDKDKEKPSDSAVISAGDADAIKASMDKNATVEGTVNRAGWSPKGSVFFINFTEAKDSKFTAVLFKAQKDDMDKAFDGDPTKALTGAKIQVTGKIIDYQGKPEIKVEKPDQIKIVAKADEATDEKKDADKKDEKKE